MDEKTLRREQRQLRRIERNAAIKAKSSITLKNLFENPDIKSKILCKTIKNNSKVLNKETLALIISQHTNIQYFNNLSKIDNYDKQELLMASFGSINYIIIDNYEFDINSVNILKYAIKYSPLKSILLSKISFTDDNVFSIFANIFNNGKIEGKIKHLILKKIDMKKQHFNIFINSIANLTHLILLEISNINIENLFTPIAPYHDGFDFLFMKVLIKLKNLKDLIFTNNFIKKMEYIYLFNEYYDFRHGYIIIDKEEFDATYVKYNIIRDPSPEDDDNSSEYSMKILEINSEGKSSKQCIKSHEVYYYTRGNMYTDGKNIKNLENYINNDCDDIINELLTELLKNLKCYSSDNFKPFKLFQ